jgi:hypothetical protein
MERFWGTVMAVVSPETFLTNICIVSTASSEADRDEEVEECILSEA